MVWTILEYLWHSHAVVGHNPSVLLHCLAFTLGSERMELDHPVQILIWSL